MSETANPKLDSVETANTCKNGVAHCEGTDDSFPCYGCAMTCIEGDDDCTGPLLAHTGPSCLSCMKRKLEMKGEL